jgi:hypothetical protein
LLTALVPDGMLESGGLTSHILRMTPTKNDRTDADDHAAALARWDDEGGAAKPSPGKAGEEMRNRRSWTTAFRQEAWRRFRARHCATKSNLQHKARLVSNLAQTPRRKSLTKVHGFWSSPLLALRRRDESDPHRTGMAAL